MTIAIISLLYLSTLIFLYLREKDTAKEREQLYDRIQSKDLTEYKNAIEIIEPKSREEKDQNSAYVEL